MMSTPPLTKRPLCWVNRHIRRVSPPVVVSSSTPGILASILKKVSNPQKPVIQNTTFSPIINYKEYLRVLELSGHPQEMIDSVRIKHEEYYASQCNITRPKKISPPVPSFTDDIVISSLTDKDGKVYTVERVPFKNFNKTKNPRDTIEMYRSYGWNESQMKDLEKKITVFENSIASRNARFEEVMSQYSGKTPAKKKKMALRTRFGKQRLVVIKKEDLNISSDDEV